MDDVGIDQMTSFGYSGVPGEAGPNNIAALMPNIDAVAHAGVRFRNAWSMPECSPGRAVLLTGRYPLRSNIYQANGPADLNNSHVATWEMTAPKLLKRAHYNSGLFGKFHLGGTRKQRI
jgi:arylsulfatase A-like enzyme